MQPLVPVSVTAPGFKGLNKQVSAIDLEPGWALDATNCVIDGSGRIASRKGWTALNTSIGAFNIEALAEYLKIDGTTQIISAANSNIYSGTTTLTSIYSTAITANRWQMVNFNNFLWLFQVSHAPLRWDGTTMVTIASLGGAGTPPQANCVLAAYGRLWAGRTQTDRTVLYYSDTLLGQNWSGGAAGTLDLKSVWTHGMDEITSIAAFNGFLVIFGRKSILVYEGPTNPSTMSLVEHIKGVGCVARDSVQDIGTDILFLSDTGVRSLARTIQEKSMPMRDISRNVRDEIVSLISGESDLNNVVSVYHEPERFYLLNFPVGAVTYCIDVSRVLEDGSSPVTSWTSINPRSLLSTRAGLLYLGRSGVIGQYKDYKDNGSSYTMSYLTAWLSFEQPFIQKILKKILFTVVGALNTVFTVKWAFDYKSEYFSQQQTITGDRGSEYNVGEYNVAEYSAGVIIDEISTPGKSTGKMVQVGLTANVNGSKLAIQKFDVYAKAGRMI